MLKEKILQEINHMEGNISFIVKDLNEDKYILEHEVHKIYPSASTIKILIMIEAMNQVNKGIYSLEDMIKIKEDNRVDYSIISELLIDEYRFLDLITLMIIVSDNTATNILIDLLGYDNINKMGESLGLKDTYLRRKMIDFQAAKEGRENTTSIRDMGILLENIYNRSIVSPEHCIKMEKILQKQQHKDLLTRYIVEDITIGHKSGELHNLNHDVGIVRLKNKDYIIGVFVSKAKNNIEAKKIIGKVSKIVYDYFNKI